MDPQSAQMAELPPAVYWRTPFGAICGGKGLTEYTVLDVERARKGMTVGGEKASGMGHVSKKHELAEVWVVKSAELGTSGAKESCVNTHLGRWLKAGDSVLGFDLANSNVNDPELEKLGEADVPDVILVKKVYDRNRRARKRNWNLKRLAQIAEIQDGSSVEGDYMEFLEDLEDEGAYRQNVNVYRKPRELDELSSVPTDNDEETYPQIPIEEMLDDLVISDNDEDMG